MNNPQPSQQAPQQLMQQIMASDEISPAEIALREQHAAQLTRLLAEQQNAQRRMLLQHKTEIDALKASLKAAANPPTPQT
ncbi:MAG: hypothetical protein JO277_07830 [Candidatus Eremiobacteraeota bacterium]|nr:hypothetical protein [Candidatus Eremiobacteraeota bacterium]